MIGTSLLVQGTPIGVSSNGKLMIKVGDRVFLGWPIPRMAAVNP